MSKNILVIVAHPDDEILGCGATLAKHVKQGDKVDILFLADGEKARGETIDTSGRKNMARAAAQVLGINAPKFLEFPDNRLDSLPLLDIVKAVEVYTTELQPQIIYTHHGGDLNIDHQIVHRAVLTACRPLPGSSVRAIYTFETLSSTGWNSHDLDPGFRPLRYVDVSKFIDIKLAALEQYRDEMRDFPHARSFKAIKSLAEMRGAETGVNFAEAFGVVRLIES